jgi:hypothetical protein
MEGAMPARGKPQPKASPVEGALNTIAQWVTKYRMAVGAHLGPCGPEEVRQTARDLGVATTQMRELMNKGPGAADLLQNMLVALHVDPKKLAKANPAVVRDLQRLCITCSNKTLCAHELDVGTAAEHFRDYCPNAFTLDALFAAKGRRSKH